MMLFRHLPASPFRGGWGAFPRPMRHLRRTDRRSPPCRETCAKAVLNVLRGGPLGQDELPRLLGIKPEHVTEAVDYLCDIGLAEKHDSTVRLSQFAGLALSVFDLA